MTSIEERGPVETAMRARARTGLARTLITPVSLVAEAVLIVAVAVLTAVAWHLTWYRDLGPLHLHLTYGVLVAAIYCGLSLAQGEYTLDRLLTGRHPLNRALYRWGFTTLAALSIGFLTKSTDIYSRGAGLLFLVSGFGAVALYRLALTHAVAAAADQGWLHVRRLMVIGRPGDVQAFARRARLTPRGLKLAGTYELGEGQDLVDDLAAAVARARLLAPDDIMIACPWSDTALIEQVVDAFLTVPSMVHLAPEPVLERFSDASIARLGGLSSLQITRPALSPLDLLMKRSFDLIGATTALVVLSPLLLVVALAIKLDSPGPVFFRQRRYGFNQQPFRILKFRTMVTLDDGPAVPQARAGDARITRVGAILRRTNLDELPQLWNVILGHMSLVGPRPHAVAHDDAYADRIALYARRHNMKPGITGWAQVNGFRGETDTDDKMRGRVQHDLWYIDNWSLLLDLKICLLTVISPKAYRNAR